MELEVTVRNVTNFGAFIDIGLKNDALLHISEFPTRINDLLSILSVGDIIKVKIKGVELERGRVSLTKKGMRSMMSLILSLITAFLTTFTVVAHIAIPAILAVILIGLQRPSKLAVTACPVVRTDGGTRMGESGISPSLKLNVFRLSRTTTRSQGLGVELHAANWKRCPCKACSSAEYAFNGNA